MVRRPPRSTRTYTLFPYTTLFRSLWFVRVLENEPVPDYAGRNRRTNAAIAAPISSGPSSWMKWAPATVILVWFGHVRQKSRIRPVVKDPGAALMKSFGIGLSLSQPA